MVLQVRIRLELAAARQAAHTARRVHGAFARFRERGLLRTGECVSCRALLTTWLAVGRWRRRQRLSPRQGLSLLQHPDASRRCRGNTRDLVSGCRLAGDSARGARHSARRLSSGPSRCTGCCCCWRRLHTAGRMRMRPPPLLLFAQNGTQRCLRLPCLDGRCAAPRRRTRWGCGRRCHRRRRCGCAGPPSIGAGWCRCARRVRRVASALPVPRVWCTPRGCFGRVQRQEARPQVARSPLNGGSYACWGQAQDELAPAQLVRVRVHVEPRVDGGRDVGALRRVVDQPHGRLGAIKPLVALQQDAASATHERATACATQRHTSCRLTSARRTASVLLPCAPRASERCVRHDTHTDACAVFSSHGAP